MSKFNKIVFQLKTMTAVIFSLPWLNVVMIIVLSVSFILPLIYLSWLDRNAIVQESIAVPFDYRLNFHGKLNWELLTDESYLSKLPEISQSRSQALIIRDLGTVNEQLMLLNVVAMDKMSFALERSLVRGRFPSAKEFEEQDDVCVITEDLLYKNRLALGDRVGFRGQELEIIGVAVKPYAVPTILVAANYLQKLDDSADYSYTVDIWTEGTPEPAQLEGVLRAYLGNTDQLRLSDFASYYQSFSVRLTEGRRYLIGKTFAMLLLSCFSMSLLMGAYFLNKQRLYGIKFALGASQKDIWLEMVSELGLLALVAALIDLVIIHSGASLFIWIAPIYLSFSHALKSLILSVMVSTLVSTIVWFFAIRKKPCYLISR